MDKPTAIRSAAELHDTLVQLYDKWRTDRERCSNPESLTQQQAQPA